MKQTMAGFTLIELLVAVSILVIIGGTVYTVFNTALNVYQKSESRIVMNQKCRVTLDRIATDLSNLQAIQGDEALVLISMDNPTETGDADIISFVTLVNIEPDPFLTQLNAGNRDTLDYEDEENVGGLMSDVRRVAYYIGPDPAQQEADTERRGAMLRQDDEQSEPPVLLRIITTALEPETVIEPLLETGTIPTEDDEGNPIQVDVTAVVDLITSFDLKYSDGEEWYESWEDPETIPKAVQIIVTVAPESSRQNLQSQQNRRSTASTTATRSATATQSTMVYLMMSANFSEQPPGGQAGE